MPSFLRNSNDFVFDTQFLVQAVHFGFRLGDVPVPVRYFDEASQINFRRSTKYGIQTVKTVLNCGQAKSVGGGCKFLTIQ